MSLESTIAALTAAIEENTRTMRELAGQTTTLPVKATKVKAEKPAPAVAAEPEPVTPEPAPAEPEAPAPVTPEPETEDADPGDPEPTTTIPEPDITEGTATDDYDSWDEPKLRLAIQEFCKTKLISADSAAFKAKFGPELAKHGVEKAAKLPADKLAEFYRAALAW